MFNFSLSQAGLPSGFENGVDSLAPDVSLTVKSENAVFHKFLKSDTPSLQNRTLQREVSKLWHAKWLTARECFWWDKKMPLLSFCLRSKKNSFLYFHRDLCGVSEHLFQKYRSGNRTVYAKMCKKSKWHGPFATPPPPQDKSANTDKQNDLEAESVSDELNMPLLSFCLSTL